MTTGLLRRALLAAATGLLCIAAPCAAADESLLLPVVIEPANPDAVWLPVISGPGDEFTASALRRSSRRRYDAGRGPARDVHARIAGRRERVREWHRLRGTRARHDPPVVGRRRDVAGAAGAAGRHRRGGRAAAGRDRVRGRQRPRRTDDRVDDATWPAGDAVRGAGRGRRRCSGDACRRVPARGRRVAPRAGRRRRRRLPPPDRSVRRRRGGLRLPAVPLDRRRRDVRAGRRLSTRRSTGWCSIRPDPARSSGWTARVASSSPRTGVRPGSATAPHHAWGGWRSPRRTGRAV